MIDLYTAATGNGRRAAVMLEECGLPYRVHAVDLDTPARPPELLRFNPLGRIPTIFDPDGPGGAAVALSQSGAILLYLAEKAGRFLPAAAAERALALQWFMFALTDMYCNASAIWLMEEAIKEHAPRTLAHFERRRERFFGALDARLGQAAFLAGELSIADLALYPLMCGWLDTPERLDGYASIARWMAVLAMRPAVARGMKVPA